MLKKIIGIVLLFVLLIQVLPVKQLGALLCSNQITEELGHTDGDVDLEKDPIKKLDFKSDYFISHNHQYYTLVNYNNLVLYIHYSERIPSNHSSDIHVPPPNC